MKLRDILQIKGSDVHTIPPSATLQQVINRLVEHNCGSLVVVDQGNMCGIITERDIVRAAASEPQPLDACFVRDHMSIELLTGTPADDISDVMGLMTQHRVRHLPITEGEQLVGIISIGDVVKAQHDRLSMENHYLKNYIQS
jgi:CBS domain-containing protein